MRVGMGYDVHKLTENRDLILGGVNIPWEKGLLGHSDADVLIHAVMAVSYTHLYAWIYMLQNNLEKIDVQMTYAHLDTEEIRWFRESFSREELEAWYQKLTGEYHKWVSFRLRWQEKRNASMKNLEFPFPYRKGQRCV